MTKSSDQILRPLTLKYAIVLGLLAALAAGNFFILSSAILDSSKLQRIVDAHGGQVHAQPNSPRGAAFVITLPCGPSPSQVREPHNCELRTP